MEFFRMKLERARATSRLAAREIRTQLEPIDESNGISGAKWPRRATSATPDIASAGSRDASRKRKKERKRQRGRRRKREKGKQKSTVMVVGRRNSHSYEINLEDKKKKKRVSTNERKREKERGTLPKDPPSKKTGLEGAMIARALSARLRPVKIRGCELFAQTADESVNQSRVGFSR